MNLLRQVCFIENKCAWCVVLGALLKNEVEQCVVFCALCFVLGASLKNEVEQCVVKANVLRASLKSGKSMKKDSHHALRTKHVRSTTHLRRTNSRDFLEGLLRWDATSVRPLTLWNYP